MIVLVESRSGEGSFTEAIEPYVSFLLQRVMTHVTHELHILMSIVNYIFS